MPDSTVPAIPVPDGAEAPDSFVDHRWAIWRAAVPLFERNGFGGVTFQQIAEAGGMSHIEIYRFFPNKQAVALFPLSHLCGLGRAWQARVAELPPEREVRLRELIAFTAGHAEAWRLATTLSSEVAATPGLERYASRMLREAREDFTAMVISIDPGMTPREFALLYEAFRWSVVTKPTGQERSADALRRRVRHAISDSTSDPRGAAALSTSWPLRTA